ncbi:MAG: SPOR domain-containing protein, partial [Bacteroidetes bacterium]|nr:SPOR domain-containing protein [Bacteroidota bacterium]
LGIGGFYAYKNIDFNALTSEKTDADAINIAEIEYDLDFEGQNNIAITGTFKDESSAKAMVNDLKVKGFEAIYFYLPDKSNSTEEVYKVFIGPYENEQETKQWIENLNLEVTLINLKNGVVLKNVKSNRLKEQEKLAKEKAEKEQLASQKVEEEKTKELAIEKENEQLKAQQEEKEKQATLKVEEEKKRKELAIAKERQATLKVKEEKKTEELAIGKERKRLEEENKKLKAEIAKLSKEENTKLKKLNEKIKITYSYKFTKITNEKGQLIITNNAGFPIIKQNYSNIQSQGGPEKLIEKVKYELDNYGTSLDGVYFEKSNTIVQVYNGTIEVLFW